MYIIYYATLCYAEQLVVEGVGRGMNEQVNQYPKARAK